MIEIESLLAERRRIATETIKPVSLEELKKLAEELFPEPSHPWHDAFAHFLTQHFNETCYAGEAGEGYSFVYCPLTRTGLWYLPQGTKGAGPLQERGIKALDEIIAEKFGA